MHKLQNNKKIINKDINKFNNDEKKIYSIKSENCLCFIPGNEKEQCNNLLLACNKKKKKENEINENILFLSIFSLDDKLKDYKYLNTNNFEVLCICQIKIIKTDKILDYKPDNDRNNKITNFFLVGGLDLDTGKGKIELFKLEEKNGVYNLNKINNFQFDNSEILNSPIKCILQSKVDGNFVLVNEEGNVYKINLPDINYL